MRKILSFIIVVILFVIHAGCIEEKQYTSSKFYVQNNCDFSIEAKYSVTYRSGGKLNRENVSDIVQPREQLYLKKENVSENFQIKDVFPDFEIYKGSVKSSFNVMDKANWTKKAVTDDNVEYILTVEDSFF